MFCLQKLHLWKWWNRWNFTARGLAFHLSLLTMQPRIIFIYLFILCKLDLFESSGLFGSHSREASKQAHHHPIRPIHRYRVGLFFCSSVSVTLRYAPARISQPEPAVFKDLKSLTRKSTKARFFLNKFIFVLPQKCIFGATFCFVLAAVPQVATEKIFASLVATPSNTRTGGDPQIQIPCAA